VTASAVAGDPNDTAAVVATWSFKHGYAMFEHAGMFGRSWSKGGLERGVDTLLSSFRHRPESVGIKPTARTATLGQKRGQKPTINTDKSTYRQRPPNEESGFLEK
jgi:hypothetical protein